MKIIINGINGAMGQTILKTLVQFKDIEIVVLDSGIYEL